MAENKSESSWTTTRVTRSPIGSTQSPMSSSDQRKTLWTNGGKREEKKTPETDITILVKQGHTLN